MNASIKTGPLYDDETLVIKSVLSFNEGMLASVELECVGAYGKSGYWRRCDAE